MAKIKETMTVSLEEFGKKAGEYALDEFEYKGLTIRQWADKIASGEYQPVKHGRWVEKEAYDEDRQMGFNFQIVCSNCDEQNSVLYSFDENSEPTEKYFMRTPWCPWCGAKMDLKEGDE